jgi:hypothetical protein
MAILPPAPLITRVTFLLEDPLAHWTMPVILEMQGKLFMSLGNHGVGRFLGFYSDFFS